MGSGVGISCVHFMEAMSSMVALLPASRSFDRFTEPPKRNSLESPTRTCAREVRIDSFYAELTLWTWQWQMAGGPTIRG